MVSYIRFYTIIFITSYKTQINIINFNFENIKQYEEHLLNSNNSQLIILKNYSNILLRNLQKN